MKKMTIKAIPLFTILPYLLSALIPLFILFLYKTLYAHGFGTMLPGSLSHSTLTTCSLAALFMFIYLKHSSCYRALSNTWCIFIALFYSLSSHALLPLSNWGIQLIFSLFPCLILCFEQYLSQQKTLGLLILLTLALSLDTFTASVTMISLFFAFIFFSESKGGAYIANTIHLLIIFAFSIALSGIFSLPAYQELLHIAGTSEYSGFDFTLPVSNFLSRFFMGSVPTILYGVKRNVSIYFGSFFFLVLVGYFFHNNISAQKRVKAFGYILLLLLALECSPLRYVFELCTQNNSSYVYFEYIFIFWALKFAGEFIMQTEQFKTRRYVGVVLCTLLLFVFAYLGSAQNFHAVALSSTVLFCVLYVICCFLAKSGKTKELYKVLMPSLLVMELICHIFLITNHNIFPTVTEMTEQFSFKENATEELVADTPNTETISIDDDSDKLVITEQEYESFTQNHIDDSLFNTLNALTAQVELSEADYKQYNAYGLLNSIDEVNVRCRKIGATQDLFTPAHASITFTPSEDYVITAQSNHIYNISQYGTVGGQDVTYIEYTFTADKDGTIVFFDTLASSLAKFDAYKANTTETGIFRAGATSVYTYNFELQGYYINTDVYAQIPDLLVNYTKQQLDANFSLNIYYYGIVSTFLAFVFLAFIYFNKDRGPIIERLNNIKNKFASIGIWSKLGNHLSKNRIYYIAFAIPFILYILTMIVFSCMPFGPNSYYDEDGIASSLPSILSAYHNIKDGNLAFSMNSGYGYSPYVTNNTFLTRSFLTPLAPSTILPLVLIIEGAFMGLTSFFMCYYLTHRLSGKRAYKGDYRILIATTIYSINTYMLAMHCFPTWYYLFFAFPLLMLAMDYLMYKKRWKLYVFSLSLCIFTNIHLSIFVCFFLIIWFFTYHFTGFKDFVHKGCRFAAASLLAAGCNFFRLVETYTSKSNSLYQQTDSKLPAFGFFDSFFEQWNQLFIFTPSQAISQNNSYINLYMGILTLILIGIYVTSRRISLTEKARKLVPLLILTISFNEEVLSYVWNGFHYQSNVPNRYVFLLMFLCASIAYDAVCELKHVTTLRFLSISGLLAIFMCLCHYFSKDSFTPAFICTLVLIAIYAILYACRNTVIFSQKHTHLKLLCGILIAELGMNMFFTTANYNLDSISYIKNFDKVSAFTDEELKSSNDFFRVATPGALQINTGTVYNLPSASIFNSFVSSSQSTLHYLYGFLSGNNYNAYNYNSTPAGLALSCHRYIYLPETATNTLYDTKNYKYLGKCENYFIFENENIFPLGFYVPSEFANINYTVTSPTLQNALADLYYTETDVPLYDIHSLTYDASCTGAPNTYHFLDAEGNTISFEEAQELVTEHAGATMSFSIREVYMQIYYTPQLEGEHYLYINEYVSMGSGNAGEMQTITLPYPNPTYQLEKEYTFVTLNADKFLDFMQSVWQNPLENIVIDNNKITASTNYEQAGYTLISLPHDNSWHAYIDGNEVDIHELYGCLSYIPTPEGQHEIELVYERIGMRIGIIGTFGFICIAILLRIIEIAYKYHRRKKL